MWVNWKEIVNLTVNPKLQAAMKTKINDSKYIEAPSGIEKWIFK